MRKFCILSVTLLSLHCTYAFSQSSAAHGGIRVYAAMGGQNVETTFSGIRDASASYAGTSERENYVSTVIGGGYTWQLNNGFTVGVLLDYDFASIEGPGAYYYEDGTSRNGAANVKVSRQWSVSVVPGYAFSDSLLVYMKLGLAKANIQLSDRESNEVEDAAGILLGVGMSIQFTRGFFGFAELTDSRYATKTMSPGNRIRMDVKPEVSRFTGGVGYRF